MENNKLSLSGINWRIAEASSEFLQEIKRRFDLDILLAKILASRFDDIDSIVNFLESKIKYLMPDPYHLLGMSEAVDRVYGALLKGEKICIFGDYDVDGATSSALLKNIFDEIGCESIIYIPDRIKEGYGPSIDAMDKIKEEGADLVITVDCGVSSFDVIDHAMNIGLDVIVIDHHISMDHLPKAVAVVNPNRLDEDSELTNLAAVGVCFLFLVALLSKLRKVYYFKGRNISEPNLMNQLDLVALGTVCDVMTLRGLNRAFVKTGLKIAAKRGNIGYRALCDEIAVDEKLTVYHLGFLIGPRINAGGRVGDANLGARLLTTKSQSEAKEIAAILNQHNENRKLIELQILEYAAKEASKQIEQDPSSYLLFIKGEDWHEGVIGIIASRIKDSYNKVAIILSLNKKTNIAKASGRSALGVNLGNKVIEAKNLGLLISGGGHANAAGFSVYLDKLDQLQEFLSDSVKNDVMKNKRAFDRYYDANINLLAVNNQLISSLSILEPVGVGNPNPVFRIDDVMVLKAKLIKEKHISVILVSKRSNVKSVSVKAMCFNNNSKEIYEALFSPKPLNLSVICHVKNNNWQNVISAELSIIDLIVNDYILN